MGKWNRVGIFNGRLDAIRGFAVGPRESSGIDAPTFQQPAAVHIDRIAAFPKLPEFFRHIAAVVVFAVSPPAEGFEFYQGGATAISSMLNTPTSGADYGKQVVTIRNLGIYIKGRSPVGDVFDRHLF